MDDADLTQQREEGVAALLRRRRAPEPGPEPCGACLNCGEPVSRGVRWCDVDCRDDWQRRTNGAERG